jgi:hypothetical protein
MSAQSYIVRIAGLAKYIVHGCTKAEVLCHVRDAVRHGASLDEQCGDCRVLFRDASDPSDESKRTLHTFDRNLLFKRDGQAVHRALELASLGVLGIESSGVLDGPIEEDLREAVCL